MILEKSKTASVPVRFGFGKNEPSNQPLVWRFTQKNGMRYRAASVLGEFSVWEEGAEEREVFRMNLGVLAEVGVRARAERFRGLMSLRTGIRELTAREQQAIWERCFRNPELRFAASTRGHPLHLGGWRRCLDRAAELLEGLGRPVPWSAEEVLLAKE